MKNSENKQLWKNKKVWKRRLRVVKVYREPLDSNEICRLYCWCTNPMEMEQRVKKVLITNNDFEKLKLNPELFYVSSYEVPKEDEEIISRFCVTCEW